jgi:hypothetical protein
VADQNEGWDFGRLGPGSRERVEAGHANGRVSTTSKTLISWLIGAGRATESDPASLRLDLAFVTCCCRCSTVAHRSASTTLPGSIGSGPRRSPDSRPPAVGPHAGSAGFQKQPIALLRFNEEHALNDYHTHTTLSRITFWSERPHPASRNRKVHNTSTSSPIRGSSPRTTPYLRELHRGGC